MKITITNTNNGSVSLTETTNTVSVLTKKTNVSISNVGIQGGTHIPSGGTSDMILAKASGSDYDMKWTNALDGITIDASMNGGYF